MRFHCLVFRLFVPTPKNSGPPKTKTSLGMTSSPTIVSTTSRSSRCSILTNSSQYNRAPTHSLTQQVPPSRPRKDPDFGRPRSQSPKDCDGGVRLHWALQQKSLGRVDLVGVEEGGGVDGEPVDIGGGDQKRRLLDFASNMERFRQFMKIMGVNPKAGEMSIRVVVDEKFGENKQAQVLDYEFFKREITLKENPKYQLALRKT